MAWTSPTTWSVGQVVTTSQLNTQIRDNLTYLKGGAGAVTLDDRLNIPLASGTNGKGLRLGDATNQYGNLQGLDSGGASYIFFSTSRQYDGTAWQQLNTRAAGVMQIADSDWSYHTFPAASNTPTERVRISSAGNLGVGTSSPQGRVHSYGSISGFLKWEYDGLDGTNRIIVPSGTGDVLYDLTYWLMIRGSGGTTVRASNSASSAMAPGNSLGFAVGADTVTLRVTAGGQVEIQRTAGAQTHKVSIICQWL